MHLVVARQFKGTLEIPAPAGLFCLSVRVPINYATYTDRVTIHCLADDARTVVAPFKRVST